MVKGFCKRPILVGFTPVELIVLITIIVSILSFIVPLIYRGTQQAKINSCADNLRQLGVWTHSYCKSADGYLPAYEDGWVQRLANIGGIQVDPNKKA